MLDETKSSKSKNMTRNKEKNEIEEKKKEAYNLGFEETNNVAVDIENKQEAYESLDNFRQYARYSNHILPELRSLAGFKDNGKGTYQKIPQNKDVTELNGKLDELTSCFSMGYIDGLLDKNTENKEERIKEI